MQTVSIGPPGRRRALYRQATALAAVTVFYNLAEGAVSVYFGLEDETFALFGFGLDSFVEVVSGLGIWHMVHRLSRDGGSGPDVFEKRALRITGSAFYVLAAGLAATSAVTLYRSHAPETTFWGIVVSSVSIATMWVLVRLKTKVGRELGSDAILADAACTRACLYLSLILLASSAGYELTGIGGMDSAGAALIAWYSFREGREAFGKARGKGCGCAGTCPTAAGAPEKDTPRAGS